MRKRKHARSASSRRRRHPRNRRREFFLRIAFVAGILMAISMVLSSYQYKATGFLPKPATQQAGATAPVQEAGH